MTRHKPCAVSRAANACLCPRPRHGQYEKGRMGSKRYSGRKTPPRISFPGEGAVGCAGTATKGPLAVSDRPGAGVLRRGADQTLWLRPARRLLTPFGTVDPAGRDAGGRPACGGDCRRRAPAGDPPGSLPRAPRPPPRPCGRQRLQAEAAAGTSSPA
jgi:hypothetical protein